MSRIARTLKKMMACRSGASAIEYALIAALISLGIAGVSAELGISTSNLFANTDEEIQTAVRVADVAPAAGPSATLRVRSPFDRCTPRWLSLHLEGSMGLDVRRSSAAAGARVEN